MTSDFRSSHLTLGPDYDSRLRVSAFDGYMARWEAHHVREIVQQLFPDRVPRYLDFACGTGRILDVLAPLARDVTGLDIAASMLAEAARLVPRARLVQGDLTRDPLGLGPFELVSTFASWDERNRRSASKRSRRCTACSCRADTSS